MPSIKRETAEHFLLIADACSRLGIELNCFLMVGIPGESEDGVRKTMDLVRSAGARVRATVYTPYHLIRSDMSIAEVSAFNRHFEISDRISRPYVLESIFGYEPTPTQIQKKIPLVVSAN